MCVRVGLLAQSEQGRSNEHVNCDSKVYFVSAGVIMNLQQTFEKKNECCF